jgi:hypothetical protein
VTHEVEINSEHDDEKSDDTHKQLCSRGHATLQRKRKMKMKWKRDGKKGRR